MADQFQVGDVVVLKSGGPKMTIQQIDTFGSDEQKAKCVWFEKSKRYDGIFPLATLQKED